MVITKQHLFIFKMFKIGSEYGYDKQVVAPLALIKHFNVLPSEHVDPNQSDGHNMVIVFNMKAPKPTPPKGAEYMYESQYALQIRPSDPEYEVFSGLTELSEADQESVKQEYHERIETVANFVDDLKLEGVLVRKQYGNADIPGQVDALVNLKTLQIENDPDNYFKSRFENQCWCFIDIVEISTWFGHAKGYKYLAVINGTSCTQLERSIQQLGAKENERFSISAYNRSSVAGSLGHLGSSMFGQSKITLDLYNIESAKKNGSQPDESFEINKYKLVPNVKKAEQQYRKKYVMILQRMRDQDLVKINIANLSASLKNTMGANIFGQMRGVAQQTQPLLSQTAETAAPTSEKQQLVLATNNKKKYQTWRVYLSHLCAVPMDS